MKPRFTKFSQDSNWVKGEYKGFKFQAKLYDVGSSFGVDGGRVSKLNIKSENDSIASYDRGWDYEPQDEYKRDILNDVVSFLENSPTRWLEE